MRVPSVWFALTTRERTDRSFQRTLNPAAVGSLVRAAASGRITRIERKGIGGLQVFITHSGGLTTLYSHLGSVVPRIAEGGTVITAGEPIGRLGGPVLPTERTCSSQCSPRVGRSTRTCSSN